MNKLLGRRQAFGNLKNYVYDKLYIDNPTSHKQQLIRSSIKTQTDIFKPIFCNSVPYKYNTTKLPSGITVLTESVNVPSTVQMGIFLDLGSRHQTQETSGSMLSIKNTYLKTAINTNETVNYGISQMSGGEFQMDFNRENSFFRASCLSHDVIDVFSMMADCAFEPKNFVAANVAIFKNQITHKFDSFLGGNQAFNDSIYKVAFRDTLGNPLYGKKSNVTNLTGYVLQQFQLKNLSPDRVVISATGIQNHQQFVDLVNQKMFFTQLNAKNNSRIPAVYQGGQMKNLVQSNIFNLAIALEGGSYHQAIPFMLAAEILGNERKSGRIRRNLLNKHAYIDTAEAFNASYSDTGIFGLKVSGSASHVTQILQNTMDQIKKLSQFSNKDFELAKQSLKARVAQNYISAWKRAEDKSKAVYYLKNKEFDYKKQIDQIDQSEVQKKIQDRLRNSSPTVIAQGGQVYRLPSYNKIEDYMKS